MEDSRVGRQRCAGARDGAAAGGGRIDPAGRAGPARPGVGGGLGAGGAAVGDGRFDYLRSQDGNRSVSSAAWPSSLGFPTSCLCSWFWPLLVWVAQLMPLLIRRALRVAVLCAERLDDGLAATPVTPTEPLLVLTEASRVAAGWRPCSAGQLRLKGIALWRQMGAIWMDRNRVR